MMGGGFFWYVIGAAALVIPFWKILPRHGIPQWAALLAALPVVAIILLWIVAFKDDFGPADGRG